MTDEALLRELLEAREKRVPCALVTVAATRGSAPRAPGAKMIVYATGETRGTVGGGRFEALAIEEGRAALRGRRTEARLKTYPLREGETDSFGAVCGGEVTVLIEPQGLGEALFLVGAGHCAAAIGRLAAECGWPVTVMDDRAELLAGFPARTPWVADRSPAEFIAGREWSANEALAIVSRNYEIDRDSLRAALRKGGMGYVGMMGSARKVRLAFGELRAEGIAEEILAGIYAPIGLDLGADSPAEIAHSVMAQMLQVLRGAKGGHFRPD